MRQLRAITLVVLCIALCGIATGAEEKVPRFSFNEEWKAQRDLLLMTQKATQRDLDVIRAHNLQLMITGAALALFTAAYVIIMHKNLVEQRKQRELLVTLLCNLIN